MIKRTLVTKTQALALKELGFNEPTVGYFWTDWEDFDIDFRSPENNNHIKDCVSIPTVDEVIDWLRRKYNIVIYNKIEPFVDPTDTTHKIILFKYGVKKCDVNNLGWNGRIDLGSTRLSTNVYSLKKEAINIALKYIKSHLNLRNMWKPGQLVTLHNRIYRVTKHPNDFGIVPCKRICDYYTQCIEDYPKTSLCYNNNPKVPWNCYLKLKR